MKVRLDVFSAALSGRVLAVLAVAFVLVAMPATALADPIKVWIDAGHGGSDPGAVAGGLSEKDTNLKISKLVAKSARRQGWKVKSTRSSDKFVGLTQRPARANAWGADAFVSIHSNSAGNRPLGHMTIYRTAEGRRLGKNIMKQLAPLTKYKDIGNRSDVRGLAVLRGSKAPAVIVELLSISSSAERKVLKDPAEQRKMAEAIVAGIAKNENVEYKAPKSKSKAKAEAKKERDERRKTKSTPEAETKSKAKAEKPEVKRPSETTVTPKTRPANPTPAPERPAAEKQAEVPAALWPFQAVIKLLFG